MQRLLNDRRVLLPVVLTSIVIAIGSVLIIAFSDDASSGTSTAPSASQPPAGGAVTIDIVEFTYKPETVTVKAGATVTWINRDAAPHTSTDSGVFDTGTLNKGDKKTVTLKKAGTYAYICELHPFMKATLIVK